jgi:hypothetical protein
MRAQLTRLGSLNRVAATAAAAMKVCLDARKLTASERDGDGALAGVAVPAGDADEGDCPKNEARRLEQELKQQGGSISRLRRKSMLNLLGQMK